jgi:hypothetical protein
VNRLDQIEPESLDHFGAIIVAGNKHQQLARELCGNAFCSLG